ncbi:Uncharacterized protein BP5553_06413 [Venustampulla echinocandica]|uniref:Class II aldolase/adducin N-terminal domain-containing protein n=1 Tax=Venustampulla echinocandica TaxID=2656787 RepID=A0A370TJU7_9HELO|nr:Uncharacterized protein BP5553_06413 [Venustampulla echinocandica]RDL35801.1 Uncharacterized protein BP5553_06413 [Venustampulla echinocandica]
MSRNIAPGTISSPSDIIAYHVDNAEPLDPKSSPGYAERCIHSEIYKMYPETQSVIHSHSDAVVPYSITGVPLKPCFHMAGFLGETTPVFDIRKHIKTSDCPDMLVRNVHLGANLATHFSSQDPGKSNHAVVLMRGHGFTVIAPDIKQCILRAIYTQKNATIQTTALITRAAHFGAAIDNAAEICYLSGLEADASTEMTSWSVQRPWELWVKEVEVAGLYVNAASP